MHSESAAPRLLYHGNAPTPTASLLTGLQLRQSTPLLTKKENKALQGGRSFNASNTPVKIALSRPAYVWR